MLKCIITANVFGLCCVKCLLWPPV